MNTTLKKLVSKKKRRYKADGYNLDLSYVSDRIIAMGFPSENMESLFRNSLDDVRSFLEEKHKDHYKIYNLCAERSYDIQKFHSRVAVYPFDDHSPPEFGQMLPFCSDVAQWLAEAADNVAVVHCKAGKGRTGLMICAYLLYSKMFTTAEDVLNYYGSARTFDSNGVTIPSQRRYVDYFATKLLKSLQFEYTPVKMYLTHFIIEPPPHIGLGHHVAHLQFQVLQPLVPPYHSEVYTVNLDDNKLILELRSPLLLSGDVKIVFNQKLNVDLLHLSTKPKFLSHFPHCNLFHFWVNTFFIDLQHSSPLSHDLAKARGSGELPLRLPSIHHLPLMAPKSGPVKGKVLPRSSISGREVFKPTPVKNRFAALSLPNLPEQFVGDGLESQFNLGPMAPLTYVPKSPNMGQSSNFSKEMVSHQLPPGCEMSVRLRKDQIDKASKDHSGRFSNDFTITMVVFKPDNPTNVFLEGYNSRRTNSNATGHVRCNGRE